MIIQRYWRQSCLGTFFLSLITSFLFSTGSALAQPPANPGQLLAWEEMPPLPVPGGLAGAYAGVSRGALIVAGGFILTLKGRCIRNRQVLERLNN